MKAHLSSLVVLALASLSVVGCNRGGGGAGGGGDLATVNGETISNDEYYRYLARKQTVQVTSGQPVQLQPGQAAELPVSAPLGFQALHDLVNRRILLQVAQDEKVMPTEDDVRKEMEFHQKQDPQFVTKLTSQGITLDDIRRDITLDLAKERVLTKGITVTPADADDFIKKNPDQFKSAEQAKVCLLVVKDAASKAQADKDLASGKPFEDVAAQYSVAPNVRQTRGVANIADMNALATRQPALAELIRATPERKATDWKPEGSQFVKIYVEQKVDAKPMTIDDTMKETVRRRLALERGAQATDLSKRLVEKLRTATINVNDKALKPLWDQAFKNLQEQDVTANTGTSAQGDATKK